MTRMYVVVPCYNEEAVLMETASRLRKKLEDLTAQGRIAPGSRVLFVNDGSKDRTWELIAQLHREQPEVFSGLKLSRNRGHQNALLAGLMEAAKHADVIVSMDADLQDDIHAVDRMLDAYQAGAEVVYGVRSARKTDTTFKRVTAEGFYRFMQAMGVDIVYNHADYRLMSRRAVEALGQFSEVNLFLRGIVPLVGFQSAQVPYERGERFAGESKYPLKIRKLAGHTVDGWTSLACSIWALGGIQLVCLGVIGEYVGKIYNETKRRPRYIVEEVLDAPETNQEGEAQEQAAGRPFTE